MSVAGAYYTSWQRAHVLRKWVLGAKRSNGIHSPFLCLAQQSILLPDARLEQTNKLKVLCHSLPNTEGSEGKHGKVRTTL